MKDSYRHKGLRKKLVESISDRGITDERVLSAIAHIPRHFFLDKAFEEIAYEDRAFPIGNEQTISQPYTVAYQTVLLDVQKREKVLEIGTGSGYQAAVLSYLGARVYTIERQEDLYKKASHFLPQIGFEGIRFYYRDGYKGLPEFAPFDKVLVTAGAKEIPQELVRQLKIGGVMVIPVGKGDVQTMYRFVKQDDNTLIEESFDDFRFVPFLNGKNPRQ